VFLRVIDLEPDAEASYASLETLIPNAGARLDTIIAKLRGFAERKPGSPLGHYLLALAIAARTPSAAEVEPLLRKAVQCDPQFWPAWFELHKPLLDAGNAEEAARVLTRAVELNPEFAPARYSLAQVLTRLGNRDGAREQRRIHHELLERQREAAEARRADAPMLPYELVRP
jgi:tetratricopeptide (TPR) repeat protein